MYPDTNSAKACSTTGMMFLPSTAAQLATLLWTGIVCTLHTSIVLHRAQILALAPMRASFQRHFKDLMTHTGLAVGIIIGFLKNKMCLLLAIALLSQLSKQVSIDTLFPSTHPTALITVHSGSQGRLAINITAFPITYSLMGSIPNSQNHVLTQCGSLRLGQVLVYPTLTMLLDPTDQLMFMAAAKELSVQTLFHLRQSEKRQGRNSMQFLILIMWIRLWECSRN